MFLRLTDFLASHRVSKEQKRYGLHMFINTFVWCADADSINLLTEGKGKEAYQALMEEDSFLDFLMRERLF